MPTRLYSLEKSGEAPKVVEVTLKRTGEDDYSASKEEAEESAERVTVEEVRKSGHVSLKRFSLFRFVARGWGRDAEDARKKKGGGGAGKKKGKSDKDQAGTSENGEDSEDRRNEEEGSSSGDTEDRRERLDREMKKNWAELPATLRRKRLRERESILAEFHHDSMTSESSSSCPVAGPSGISTKEVKASQSQADNLRRTLSRDSLLSSPSSFASSSRASSASSSSGAPPQSSSSSSTSSPPPSVNQSPTPEVRETRRSTSHPDASSSCPSADNEYETMEVEPAAFRRPSTSTSSVVLPCISSYSENQTHSDDSGTDCDHASADASGERRVTRSGHRVTFGTSEVHSDLGERLEKETVEIRMLPKNEEEEERGWKLWVGKKGVTIVPNVEVSTSPETSVPDEFKDSLEDKSDKSEGSEKTDDSGTVCSSEHGSAGRSVRELLRRFEVCGAVLTGIAKDSEDCSAEETNVAKEEMVQQPQVKSEENAVASAEDGEGADKTEDDDDDDDKNDTLRDIQETLLRLEEKVRLYESRLATEYMSKMGGTPTPIRSFLEEEPYKGIVSAMQESMPTPESSAEEGAKNVSVVEVDGKASKKDDGSSTSEASDKHQKARAQTAFQQQQGGGKAAAEQHEALLSGWNRNHAGSGQVPASPVSSMPFHSLPATPVSHLTSPHHQHHPPPSGTPPPPGDADPRTANAVHDGRHSLLQFAMFHFRQSPEKFEMLKTADGTISGSLKVIESLKGKKALGGGKKGGSSGKEGGKDVADWTWKEQVDLVKFTATPIEESLLRLESPELSALAVECFVSVMRYMGDLPMPTPDTTEVKCVYTILMHCHKHEALRDEVYCQLMKQTTNNKSRQADSCQRGWRLFSIVAAYFICSSTLKPYLFKYLETAAYDKRRAYHGTATVCLQNLRKTFKYGGRKNVPSVEEITAISAGRNSKRQIYRLPGGTERVINTKSTTVVQDIIEEICSVINVRDTNEMEEFSLYCIVEGDTFTMPLAREEYVLDVTTELQKNQQVFFLIFCRSVWHHPLRLDSGLYVEVVFNQIAPDYLEGLLLVMPGEQLEQDAVYDIAKIAALLHRAADMEHMPTMKETKFLLPKPALAVRDIKPPQWVNMVQGNWREVEALTPMQAKAHTLDILQKWPLFGSSFFAVKRISDPKERADHILALNRNGVHFIDLVTHETLLHYPFAEVISTRKVKSEEGALFLDMKCGNLMQQRITRLQTDQAHEISRLIRQYITMEQRQRGINGNHTEQPQTVVPGSEAPVSR